MFCNKCGNRLDEDARFCNECGSPVVKMEVEDPTEALEVEVGEITEALDTPPTQYTFCNKCGAKINGNELFCGECGNPLGNVANTDMTVTDTGVIVKEKENLMPLIIVLILVIIMSAVSIWFMIRRASKPISIEIPNIEESGMDAVDEEDNSSEGIENTDRPAIEEPADIEEEPVDIESEDIDGYLYPSDREYITEEYLATLTKEEIGFIRNEIFARHGYIFQKEPYKSYFSSKSWYVPNEGFNDSFLTEIEKANVDTIVNYEEKMGWN